MRRRLIELGVDPLTSASQYPTPGVLARALNPTIVQTPALDLIDAHLREVLDGRCDRLILSMPPQEGKSERASRAFPLWWLLHKPGARIAITSYAHRIARRWARAIRNDIQAHTHLGLGVADDSAAAEEWQLAGYEGSCYATGVGGSLTSRAVDLLIIDDPIKDRKEADSEVYRDNVWDWWQNVARTRLAPGAPVVLILTRWHEDDLAGRLLAEPGSPWTYVNIPAQADHRPELGQVDILGREPGQWMASARGRTVEQWEQTRREIGSYVFEALYQGRPTPGDGTVFRSQWWQWYHQPQWVVRDDGAHITVGFDELIQSWDMAFKDTNGSDFVVGQVWGRRGWDAYLLDQVCERLDFVATCFAARALSAKWPQALLKLVEDKANGTAVINALRRRIPGFVAVEPNGSKEGRARAVSPFAEGGNVYLPAPEIYPWVDGFVREHSAFPKGKHDDQVDGTSQALYRLLLAPLLAGELFEDAEHDDLTISPY